MKTNVFIQFFVILFVGEFLFKFLSLKGNHFKSNLSGTGNKERFFHEGEDGLGKDFERIQLLNKQES